MSTGTFTLSPVMVHVLGILGALVVYLQADASFVAMLPAWVATTAHALVPFLMYLGVSQVTAATPPAPPAK